MKKVINNFFKQKKLYLILEFIGLLLVIGLIVFLIIINTDDKKVEEPNIPKEEEIEQKKVSIVDVNTTSRPYAIMINNISTARPLQSGLQDAYIMYEIIVEGGITRYLALFLDADTERIGSIRSARHYYLDYALENDAIYVHHGQSPQAANDFSKLGVDRIQVNNTSTGWRDKTLNVSSEHTLFTSIEKLNNGLGNKRTTRENDLLLDYSAEEIDLSQKENSTIANSITIVYSNNTTTSYEYDSENKVYKRFVNDKKHTDYVTEEQYTFKNIITYKVDNSDIAGDTSGRQNLNNTGSGKGYYISNGYATEIKWEKKCRECQTKYTYSNGEEIIVNDGNTFIQIQPTGQKLTIS